MIFQAGVVGCLVLLLALYNTFFGRKSLGYFMLISSFLIPMPLLTLIFSGGAVGINSGGSPIYNVVLLAWQGISILIFLTNKEILGRINFPEMVHSKLKNGFNIIDGSLCVLLALSLVSDFTSSTKILPLTQSSFYAIILILAYRRVIDFHDLLKNLLVIAGIFVAINLFSMLINFRWSQSNSDLELFQSDIYFSPIGSFLGISVHNGGSFGAPNDLGIFCAFTFVIALCTNVLEFKYKLVLGIFCLITGSMSGSRTFYFLTLTAVIILIAAMLFRKSKNPATKVFSITFGLFVSTQIAAAVSSIISLNTRNLSTLNGRSTLWNLILNHWSDEGVFGHGPNSLRDYMITTTWEIAFGHAHNSFLQYLWDWGILGISSLVVFVVGSWLVLAKRDDISAGVFYLVCIYLCVQSELSFSLKLDYKGLFIVLIYTAVRYKSAANKPAQQNENSL